MMLIKMFYTSIVMILVAALGSVVYQSDLVSGVQTEITTNRPAGEESFALEGSSQGKNITISQANGSAAIERQPAIEIERSAQSPLSEGEKEGLIFMVEEEKLARDVYTVLYTKWQLPVFQNIASSEQSHMDAVKNLIDRYNLDVRGTSAPGSFSNADLQILYDDLVAQGNQSLVDALMVGAAIEEIDILDLETQLALTEHSDIQHVYNNLMRGSQNHLRAFTRMLGNQTGQAYQTQHMSQEQYQTIINQTSQGGGNGRGGNGGRGGKWGQSS